MEKITTILKQLEAQCSFSARESTDAEDLRIEIDSIGPLRFPLKPGLVKRMIKIAKPATFGWRDKTCLDSEVRNVWKIPKSRVKIDKRRWNKTLNPTMNRLKTGLGLPEQSSLRAEPKGLSWKGLKDIDRLRASALSEVAAILDLEIYLALADIREIWDCEIDEPDWGYGSRRRHRKYYEDEELG